MKKPRKQITIHDDLNKLPINPRALKRLVYHYYKGPYDIEIKADSRLHGYGDHVFNKGKHRIRINPKICSYNKNWEHWDYSSLTVTGGLVKVNSYDITCRIIHTILHELRHAHQCDNMGTKTYDKTMALHPDITQRNLKVELSDLESDAEGWALSNFKKALGKYTKWVEKYNEGSK